jgi:hypothetical protein
MGKAVDSQCIEDHLGFRHYVKLSQPVSSGTPIVLERDKHGNIIGADTPERAFKAFVERGLTDSAKAHIYLAWRKS